MDSLVMGSLLLHCLCSAYVSRILVAVAFLMFVCGIELPKKRLYACACPGPQEHFTQMRVVGQFNLGFAICLLGSDLFILDQHACDEKYNFEVLQETTTIHQQPLVR